ncbi:hypothetical protein DXG03_000280 [Asterophora parasitica]|uniref:BRCT domain-containing protein n=1 Tax=Asterophora parasitica TaxID=117018 RepID=A0A9P7KIQ2_9AGAR|nr:hypothetical protein DXG03_000280 [Asterophora parasitica]
MYHYFPVISRASTLRKGSEEKGKKRADAKYQPYRKKGADNGPGDNKLCIFQFREQLRQSDTKASSSALNKFLLHNLSDESNPITHSDIRERSDCVISTSTGHQVAEAQVDRRLYMQEKERKLVIQRDLKPKRDAPPQVLSNVRVYINGFLENTTDIEMKRIVIEAGGQVLPACTHILTSQQLSGTKTHKLLTTKSRSKVHVVKPEWIFDSIAAGKRRHEREYAILKSSSTKTLYDMLQK